MHEDVVTDAGAEGQGIAAARLERVLGLLRQAAQDGSAPGAALYVSRYGRAIIQAAFGRIVPLGEQEARAAQPDTIFLVASLTKPVTATAACLLVDRGQLLLRDPVSSIIPEFAGEERQAVQIRHLLTHTSGLPDMLPENTQLRQRRAPLSAFVEGSCATPLLFPPGADCRYQSMGFALLGAVVERIAGMPLAEFVRREILAPLGMADSWLGLGRLPRSRIAQVAPGREQVENQWIWNSDYWRDLAAPWGGLHTTASDYARFLEMFLDGEARSGERILSRAMIDAMLTDQVAAMPGIAAAAWAEQSWGLGWRLNQPRGSFRCPEAGSPRTFGHVGSTGCMAWADPASGLACVLLTTQPLVARLQGLVSNAVAALVE